MVVKPCERPTFFVADNSIFYLLLFFRKEHYNISPILGCLCGRHLFLRIIKILIFYCFVRYDHYNISPILGCFCGRHLFWRIIKKFILYSRHLQEECYITLQDLPHVGM